MRNAKNSVKSDKQNTQHTKNPSKILFFPSRAISTHTKRITTLKIDEEKGNKEEQHENQVNILNMFVISFIFALRPGKNNNKNSRERKQFVL